MHIVEEFELHSNMLLTQYEFSATCGAFSQHMTYIDHIELVHGDTMNGTLKQMWYDHHLKRIHKYNDELQRTNLDKKVTGEFSTRGRIFPPNTQNIFFISIVLVGKKYTFIDPVKIGPKNVKELPPLDHDGLEMKFTYFHLGKKS